MQDFEGAGMGQGEGRGVLFGVLSETKLARVGGPQGPLWGPGETPQWGA